MPCDYFPKHGEVGVTRCPVAPKRELIPICFFDQTTIVRSGNWRVWKGKEFGEWWECAWHWRKLATDLKKATTGR